jgi:hypothetical protein
VIKRLVVAAALCLALVPLAGCSRTYHIQIQSDTCWEGLVNGDQFLSDCGDSNYKVVGKLTCMRVSKITANGYLRMRVDGGPWAETTQDHGVLQICQ